MTDLEKLLKEVELKVGCKVVPFEWQRYKHENLTPADVIMCGYTVDRIVCSGSQLPYMVVHLLDFVGMRVSASIGLDGKTIKGVQVLFLRAPKKRVTEHLWAVYRTDTEELGPRLYRVINTVKLLETEKPVRVEVSYEI